MASRTAKEAYEVAPELTDAELAEMRPAREVHSRKEFDALKKVRKRGRPSIEKPKERVTIRLDPEIVAAFKAGGDGWQTRMNTFLTDCVVKRRTSEWIKVDANLCLTKRIGIRRLRKPTARKQNKASA